MKLWIFLFFLIILGAHAISEEEEETEWNNFKATHRKTYRSSVEDNVREKIFKTNLRKIDGHNKRFQKGEVLYELGINQFADLTRDEFVEMLTLQKRFKPRIPKENLYYTADPKLELPKSVNWTEKGAVTEIKNQLACGSCWSFSATGSIEGQLFLKTGNLTSLSEQNLLDCVLDCYGCYGGYMDRALEYVRVTGIMKEEEYPYEAQTSHCRFQNKKSVTKIESIWFIKPNDEYALQAAVAKIGPISVPIDATGLQFYKSGIYTNDFSCGNSVWNLNHGVLLVGYGSINETDYWFIKNSWGKHWGIGGYLLMARNRDNQCGVATEAVFPQI